MADTASSSQPLAIIDAKFCAPKPVQLIITRKAPEKKFRQPFAVSILDSDGNLMFKTDSSFNLKHGSLLVDASGCPLVSIQKQRLNLFGLWKVFKGDSTNPEDLLFTVRRSSPFRGTTKLLVFMATNNSKECDFQIKGSYKLRGTCKVYKGDSPVVLAKIMKERQARNVQLKEDDFVMDIEPSIDSAFISALIVIRHEILLEQFRSIFGTGLTIRPSAHAVAQSLVLIVP